MLFLRYLEAHGSHFNEGHLLRTPHVKKIEYSKQLSAERQKGG